MERLLLITPCRDEAEHLERTLASVAAQTRPPDLWLIVDDGSTDATPEILNRWAARLSYLEIMRTWGRAPGGDGLATAAEAAAFNRALESVTVAEFSHVGKLDADIELAPDYFQRLLDRFAVEGELGILGGTLLEDHGRGWEPTGGPEHHVRGALKLYRRDCLEALGGGIEERLGWDTIDEVEARMRGYRTRTLAEPTARHLRPVATRGGILRGRARLGRAAFILRYSPWWVAAKSAQVALKRPYVLGGIAYFWGYLRAAASDRRNRVEDPEFARFVAAELRGRAFEGMSFFHPTRVDQIR
jgi:glycosyltransferase involved in cell wall biosynthesis